jgi:hypothetical protein
MRLGGWRHGAVGLATGGCAAVGLMLTSGCTGHFSPSHELVWATSADGPDEHGVQPSEDLAAAEGCPQVGLGEEDPIRAGVEEAAGEIIALGARYPNNYMGTMVCFPIRTVFVYRVPGSRSLDARLAEVARKYVVAASLRDTKYTVMDLQTLQNQVYGRRTALQDLGAPLVGTSYDLGGYVYGYVIVEVERNVAAAREVLADLGDRVRVRKGAKAVPL